MRVQQVRLFLPPCPAAGRVPIARDREQAGHKSEEATTTDTCAARTTVLAYPLICVLEATLEVILSKHFMLQETKPR